MNKRRVILRADASTGTGFGHFYRSLALANHLKDDFDCYFASYNEDESLGAASEMQLKNLSDICTPLVLVGDSLEEANNNFIQDINQEDIVILDNYYYTTAYQEKIKSKGCKLVCIDDMPNRHFLCDVLITGTPYNRTDFSLENYTKFKSGIEWVFLRDAFLQPVTFRQRNVNIQRIAIAMGGSDPFNLTDKIIRIVTNLIPTVNIEVIAGPSVTVSYKGNNQLTVHRNISADKIVNLYENVDLAILPASTLSIEALSRNVKIFAGHFVYNQKKLYDYCVNKGFFMPLGNLLDSDYEIESRLSFALHKKFPTPQITCFQDQKKKSIELFKSIV